MCVVITKNNNNKPTFFAPSGLFRCADRRALSFTCSMDAEAALVKTWVASQANKCKFSMSENSKKGCCEFCVDVDGNTRLFQIGDGGVRPAAWTVSADTELEDTYYFSENVNEVLTEKGALAVEDVLNVVTEACCDMGLRATSDGEANQGDGANGFDDEEEYNYGSDDGGSMFVETPAGTKPPKKRESASQREAEFEVSKRFSTGKAGNANKRLMQDLMSIMSQDTSSLGFLIEQVDEDRFDKW